MIAINAEPARKALALNGLFGAGGHVLTTYSLFIHHETEAVRFEPYLGEDHGQALTRAQELMTGDAGTHTVEVHFGDSHLLSVGRTGS